MPRYFIALLQKDKHGQRSFLLRVLQPNLWKIQLHFLWITLLSAIRKLRPSSSYMYREKLFSTLTLITYFELIKISEVFVLNNSQKFLFWPKLQTSSNGSRPSFNFDANARLYVHCRSRRAVVVLRIFFIYLSLRGCATCRDFRIACQIFLSWVASRTLFQECTTAHAHNRAR